jgi:hypothetical protein
VRCTGASDRGGATLTHRVEIFDQTTERVRHAARMSAVERVLVWNMRPGVSRPPSTRE